jgi:hypothetical protein
MKSLTILMASAMIILLTVLAGAAPLANSEVQLGILTVQASSAAAEALATANTNATEASSNGDFNGISLCSDPNFAGTCKSYGFKYGDCVYLYDFEEGSIKGGVSSMVLLQDEMCWFYSTPSCALSVPGAYPIFVSTDSVSFLPENVDGLIYSFVCGHRPGGRSILPRGEKDANEIRTVRTINDAPVGLDITKEALQVEAASVERGIATTNSTTNGLTLCDGHWSGFCEWYTFTYGVCFNLSDGKVAQPGKGVASMVLRDDEQCWFYSGLDCNTIVYVNSHSIQYLPSSADRNILSFACTHAGGDGRKRNTIEPASEPDTAIAERDINAITFCDDQWNGVCRDYGFIYGQCGSLTDGIVAKAGNGVSSFLLPSTTQCSFYSDLYCNYNNLILVASESLWALQPPADNSIYSFNCFHSPGSKSKRELAGAASTASSSHDASPSTDDVNAIVFCDDHFTGNCKGYIFVYGECGSLTDGIVAKPSNGISSIILNGDDDCYFWSQPDCRGELALETSKTIEALSAPADDNIYSFSCFHHTARRTCEVIRERDITRDGHQLAKRSNSEDLAKRGDYSVIMLFENPIGIAGASQYYVVTSNQCMSLGDGIIAKHPNGVSAIIMPGGLWCNFYSGYDCQGDIVLVTDETQPVLSPPADDNIFSLLCQPAY